MRVVAAVLRDAAARVLVSQRPIGKQHAGFWEFPGGKLEPGESARDGVNRELREELGIDVLAARELMTLEHNYPDKRVQLAVWMVEEYAGAVVAAEAQVLRWAGLDELATMNLLPADWPIVEKLKNEG